MIIMQFYLAFSYIQNRPNEWVKVEEINSYLERIASFRRSNEDISELIDQLIKAGRVLPQYKALEKNADGASYRWNV